MARKNYGTEINKWISLCKLSESERQTKQPKWDSIDKYFRGWQWDDYKSENKDIITVNLVYSHVKIVIPSVYLRYPKVYFNPQTPSAIDGCALLEQVLNADMRKMKLKEVNKRVLQDVILYGTGFSKTTFEIDGDIPSSQEDINANKQLREQFYDGTIASVVGGNIKIPKASPRSIRISPRDVGFSVGATDFGDPGFISHRSRIRLQKIKDDPYYKNTKDLQPTARIKNDIGPSNMILGYESEKYLDMIDLYEIWDVDNQKWLTVAEGGDKYLTDIEDNPYPVDHPFDKLVFTPLDDQMWGFGEIEPWLPQQDELNSIRSQQSGHRKRYNRKYGVLANAFETEEEEAKLTSGEDGVVIKFRANRSIQEQISPIQDAPMPADVYRMNVIVEDDIVKIGRLTPYRRGGTTGANTATEANLAEAAGAIGDKDRIDAVSEFTLNQLEKVRKMRAALTIGREMIDTTGNPMDENRWQYWTREDIDVESMMSIEFGSTQPQNDQERQQKGLLLYQQALANPTVNPQSAFSKLLEAFGERNQSTWFLPSEIIQLQMMMKAMGAAKEQQKGISPMGQMGQGEPGPAQTTETPAELAGRAAPINRVGNG